MAQMSFALHDLATLVSARDLKKGVTQLIDNTARHEQQLAGILHQHGVRPKKGVDQVTACFVKRIEQIVRSMIDQDLRDVAFVSVLQQNSQYQSVSLDVLASYAEVLYLGLDRHTLLVCAREQKADADYVSTLQDGADQLALLVSPPSY